MPVLTVVVHRYRRSRGHRARPDALAALGRARDGALVVALAVAARTCSPASLLGFLVMVLPALAMTVAVVNPTLVSIDELLGRTAGVRGARRCVLVAVDFAVVAGLTALLDDSLAQSQVVLVVLLVDGPALRPAAAAALPAGCAGWCWVTGPTRTTPSPGWPRPSRPPTRAASSSPRSPARSPPAFGVGFVSVEVDRSGGERLVATHGERPAETRTLPISYRDAEVGRLVLPARACAAGCRRRDEELLGDLVRQAATAARTSQLADELQESRERLVTAREEERRRIRRDLHDGLGPALSGVVFQLESARLLVDRDPEAAKARSAATSEHVQEVVADVRRLVHDLRPPALDDLGLVGALRQQAERLDRSGDGRGRTTSARCPRRSRWRRSGSRARR